MNILPKKRWHVRTKDNIARVRRDEAAAAEEEQKRQNKLELAESEARINFLRRQSGAPEKVAEEANKADEAPSGSIDIDSGRGVDLFADYKSHVKTTNKDLEKERKDEQEKYEKQIGYLTYLGQDTNEALKVRSWYEVAPKRAEVGEIDATETQLKHKLAQDPLTLINALLPPEKKAAKPVLKRKRDRTPDPKPDPASPSPTLSKSKKEKHHKKNKKHKSHKGDKLSKSKRALKELAAEAERAKRDKLERLRKERLRREAVERERQDTLLAPKEATTTAASATPTPAPTPRIVQKYNSQFNPEFAKQNMV